MADRVIDPVCGMTVDPATARGGSHEHGGTTYYFCSPGCRTKFAADPERYLRDGPTPHAPAAQPISLMKRRNAAAPAATPSPPPAGGQDTREYTCPMHPEVVHVGPGDCPICGMALEPREISLDEGTSPELRDMTRRFWIAVAFSAPLLLLMAIDLVAGHDAVVPMTSRPWLELALATPVCTWAATPFFVRAWHSIVRRQLNMFTLIGLGVAAAYGYSLVATLAPGILPLSFRDEMGRVPVYFEAAAVIVTLVLLGQVLELRARHRTGSAIRALLALAPAVAHRLRQDGTEEEIPLSHVHVGDRLRIRPGGRVPTDGILLEGTTAIDESMITGESMPVQKRPGDRVVGSTLNGTGSVVMRAERIGRETLLARIVAMVAEAQRSRAPIQRLVDVVSAYFVATVLAAAVVTFIVWASVGPEPRLAHALVNSVAVLIIACPCALGLATPMSIMVATGRGATQGVLFRDAEAIETLGRVDTLAFDKTGTLTAGTPAVTTVRPFSISEADVIALAASVERGSEHPLAAAIVREATSRRLATTPAAAFASVTGKGVRARVDGRDVAVGNLALMAQIGAKPGDGEAVARERQQAGDTVVYVAVDGQLAGVIGIADPIKSSTPAAVDTLRQDGLRLVMLTGDHPGPAKAVASRLGIDEAISELLPDAKRAWIQARQREGARVAMAGDGVNDAPALAQADVGIALGTGTDVAMQSAGVTLVKGDLRAIARARQLSRLTMTNIRQNLFFAFVYNAVGVPIAAGVLYPWTGLLLNPMIAAAAMSFSSVSVIGNALRLRYRDSIA
jgi:Cu+-exporting ATPase